MTPIYAPPHLASVISENVRIALREDIGDGDITAQLIPEHQNASATILVRENAVICGIDWVNEVFSQMDSSIIIQWHAADGDPVEADSIIATLTGKARHLLTGERAALNFLQTLSGTATRSAEYASLVEHQSMRILDTRKTLPGLRDAQKYAVNCGGCDNHRMGLYDAFLIKENHIAACGGITAAIERAREIAPGKTVEVEVENLEELGAALEAGADIIMLDNFDDATKREAVKRNAGQAILEASGNVNRETLLGIADTGVDCVSIGTLTKDVRSIDLSMRFKIDYAF